MNCDGLKQYAERKTKRYQEFLDGGPGELLLMLSCPGFDDWLRRQPSGTVDRLPMAIPDPMTEEFLSTHAYDSGVRQVQDAQLAARFRMESLDDDCCAGILFHPGAGYQAAMSSGGNLRFLNGGASYTTEPALTDWDKMDEAFHHDNRWIDYALEFWRGVDSVDTSGLFVSPRYNRSPLDLANDLRGDRLFMDLYDSPDEVSAFVDKCADSIIAIDKILRAGSATLRNAPGGCRGAAMGCQAMILNGDPLDLISSDMVLRFNNPALEKVTHYCPGTMLHHHSIGISRALAVSEVRRLAVQEIFQDPNGPRIADSISDDVVAASWRTPIYLQFPATDIRGCHRAFLETLLRGRFIVDLWGVADIAEARGLVQDMRRMVETRRPERGQTCK